MERFVYRLTRYVCYLMRQFILPNPFEGLFPAAEAFLYNVVATGLLGLLSYGLVGCFYHKGFDAPAKGSFLYFLFYACLTAVLYLTFPLVKHIIT